MDRAPQPFSQPPRIESPFVAFERRAVFKWTVSIVALLCIAGCERASNSALGLKDNSARPKEASLVGGSAGNPAPKDADEFARSFKCIAAGSFQMGSREEGAAVPVWVDVPEFYISETEVCFGEWSKVRDWAKAFGYEFANAGTGGDAEKPVANVDWYDAVKWCNAMSERAGLRPCYHLREAGAKDEVFRRGKGDTGPVVMDANASGYRLPTEAEWEKAARGGVAGKKFPLGDTLAKTDANFSSASAEMVRSFPPNQYGIFDMAGNVWEWCWDVYDASNELNTSQSRDSAARELSQRRVIRGGGWDDGPGCCSVSYRNGAWPEYVSEARGFRVVRK